MRKISASVRKGLMLTGAVWPAVSHSTIDMTDDEDIEAESSIAEDPVDASVSSRHCLADYDKSSD